MATAGVARPLPPNPRITRQMRVTLSVVVAIFDKEEAMLTEAMTHRETRHELRQLVQDLGDLVEIIQQEQHEKAQKKEARRGEAAKTV